LLEVQRSECIRFRQHLQCRCLNIRTFADIIDAFERHFASGGHEACHVGNGEALNQPHAWADGVAAATFDRFERRELLMHTGRTIMPCSMAPRMIWATV